MEGGDGSDEKSHDSSLDTIIGSTKDSNYAPNSSNTIWIVEPLLENPTTAIKGNEGNAQENIADELEKENLSGALNVQEDAPGLVKTQTGEPFIKTTSSKHNHDETTIKPLNESDTGDSKVVVASSGGGGSNKEVNEEGEGLTAEKVGAINTNNKGSEITTEQSIKSQHNALDGTGAVDSNTVDANDGIDGIDAAEKDDETVNLSQEEQIATNNEFSDHHNDVENPESLSKPLVSVTTEKEIFDAIIDDTANHPIHTIEDDLELSTPKNILDNESSDKNSNKDVDNLLTSSLDSLDLSDKAGPSAAGDSPQTEDGSDLTKPSSTNDPASQNQINPNSNKISTTDKTSNESETNLIGSVDNIPNDLPVNKIDKNPGNDSTDLKENVPNNLTPRPHILTDSSKTADKVNALLDNKGPNETNDTESENVTKDQELLGDKPNDENTPSNEEFTDKNENNINKNSLLSNNDKNEIFEESKVDIEAVTNPSSEKTEEALGDFTNEKHDSDIDTATILSTTQNRDSDKTIEGTENEFIEGGLVSISEMNKPTLDQSQSGDDILGTKPLETNESVVNTEDSLSSSEKEPESTNEDSNDDKTVIIFNQDYKEVYNDDVDDDYNDIGEEIVDTGTKKLSTTTLRSIVSTSKPFNLETPTTARLPPNNQSGSKQNIIDTLAKLFVRTLDLSIRIKNAIDANAVDTSENVLQIISRKDPEIHASSGETAPKVPTLIKVMLSL